jgi:uncharacterized protein (TIGR02118 family)
VSVCYFVRYEIENSEEFLRHYREVHVPIVARWPGLQRMVIHTPMDWNDPFPVNRGKAVLLAQLEFESVEAMNRAFASRERAEAREDFNRFMTFEGTVTHQAMKAEEVWRSPWLDGHEEQA